MSQLLENEGRTLEASGFYNPCQFSSIEMGAHQHDFFVIGQPKTTKLYNNIWIVVG